MTLLVVVAGLMTGCVTSPTNSEVKANCGECPANYQEQIKAHHEKTLYDPYSAKYQFSTPKIGYRTNGWLLGGEVRDYGYWVAYTLNAKNRLGGYVGAEEMAAYFTDGKFTYTTYQSLLSFDL